MTHHTTKVLREHSTDAIVPYAVALWSLPNDKTPEASVWIDLATGRVAAAARSWRGIHQLDTLYCLAMEERALWLAELSRENPPTIPAPGNR